MKLRSFNKTMISTKLIFNGHYPAIRLIPASCQQKLRNVKRLRFLLWPMLEYNWDCFQGIISEPPHRHSHPKFYAIWYAQLFPRYFSWKFSNADRSIYLLSDFLRATKTFNQPSITLQPSTGCITTSFLRNVIWNSDCDGCNNISWKRG